MPIYCYRLSDGRVIDRLAPMSRIPRTIKVDGLVGERDRQAESCGVAGTSKTWRRPNMALGVHPKQVPELQQLLKHKGVRDTQFNAQGDCMVQDRTHRNDILKARGMLDRAGGYGDHTGK